MDICTIIAKNYLAQARVLARSFAEHHSGRCFVLVIDEYKGYFDPADEPFTMLTPEQIGCAEFREMALRYDVLELSTAVKPWLLSYLFDQGAPAITYLDPDIRIYSSLEALDELARSHGVVLTPHNTVPLPDDGKRPNQIDILMAGVYNLGYVSLGAGQESTRLLGWWRERLLNDCRVDPPNGYFVDQRWFDLAPGLVSDHAIMREPQYNVAYWNLHSRRLEHDGSTYTADGEPLAFFHFSGFDPQKPELLSRHQSRLAIDPESPLQRICVEYADEVDACGYREIKGWPYTFHLLPAGIEFNSRLRKLYEIAVEAGEVEGSPFTQAGEESFMGWLGEPAPNAPPGVNRVLAELYGTRVDLQEAFPEVAGKDHAAFLFWAQRTGVIEEPVLGRLPSLDLDELTLAPSVTEELASDGEGIAEVPLWWPVPDWGVNVVGYFNSELGVGEAARQVISALDAGGVSVLPMHGQTVPPNRQGHAFTYLDHTEARYPINLICMNADVLGEFASQAGSEFFENHYSIGMWFWEVEQFPDMWMSAFDHVDELWLPTDHVARSISAVSSVPVTKITLPIEMPVTPPASRVELGLPEGFMFLFSFDYHSVFERKNPLAVIEAYKRGFDPAQGAVLVLKSINADSSPKEHARLIAAAEDRPDIHIIDGYLSPERKNLMVAACDCYVSLHRAEGFGLTMAEAMYLGKPVIATSYSGNLDFMTESNSFLVEHDMVKIGPDALPYPADGHWAEPDVDRAARLMREVFDAPEWAAERGRRGAEDIRRTHSAEAAGEIMGRRLDLLRDRHGERLVQLAVPCSLSTRLERRVQVGPLAGADSRLGLLGRGARRVLLRIMKPFTAYQQSVNAETARVLSVLERGARDADATSTKWQSALLAALRDERSRRQIWEWVAGLSHSTMALESTAVELQRAVGELPEVPQRINELSRSLQHLEWEGRAVPYMEGAPFGDIDHAQVGIVQGYQIDPEALGVEAYRSFEDTFRGSEEFIRDRQRIFLRILGGRAPVLDFGCGRGEFLDLLTEEGIPFLGVDSDEGMVRRCHEKGYTEVVHGDGLEYLQELEDGSLGAIFSAQVIEHLPYGALLRLLALARQKLSTDGLFLAETVNPHSGPALKTFWVDPTHQHPLFPEVALHLCRSAGFASAFVFHPNGTGDVERDRFTQGEYAIVAGGESLLVAQAESMEPGTRAKRDQKVL